MIPDWGDPILLNFKAKYSSVHPLVFYRSVERAKNYMDLFEILGTIPSARPYSWSESERAWVNDDDFMSLKALKKLKRGPK